MHAPSRTSARRHLEMGDTKVHSRARRLAEKLVELHGDEPDFHVEVQSVAEAQALADALIDLGYAAACELHRPTMLRVHPEDHQEGSNEDQPAP